MDKTFYYLYGTYLFHLLTYLYILIQQYLSDSLHSLTYNVLLYLMISYEVQYVHNILVLHRMFQILNGVFKENIAAHCNQRDEQCWDSKSRYELWQLCDIHWTLCQSVQNHINGQYSCRLLGIIVLMFLALLEMPFLVAIHLFNWRLQSAASAAVWFCLHVLQLLAIAYSCAFTTDEANNTKNIVCEYLVPGRSVDLTKQLKRIESQLSAHKADFDAAGIFELDRSFVAWMVGAITTYLVIFIQLQESSVWNIPKTAIW